MTTPILHRPARGSASVPPLHILVNRPVLPRPAVGPCGLAPDAISEFLARLMKQHESAAIIFRFRR